MDSEDQISITAGLIHFGTFAFLLASLVALWHSSVPILLLMQVEILLEHMQSHYASLMQRAWNTFSCISVFILGLCVCVCVRVCVCVCVRGVLVGMNHRRYGAGPVPRHCCVRAYECIFSQRNLCHFPNHPSCYLQSPCSQDSSLFVSCPLLTDSFPNVTLFSLTRNVSIHCVPFTGNVLCIFPSLLHLGHPSLY